MNTIQIPSWEAFEEKLRQLRADYQNPASPLLFRGQGNSEWHLTTTLERNESGRMPVMEYYRLICSTGPEVRAFANVDVPQYADEILRAFSDAELLSPANRFPSRVYAYMAYLRHFGFPSPLLDWSRSPYVAAFFAFRDPLVVGCRSIYAYCERPKGVKAVAIGEPSIFPMGPYIATHHRHFRQRCDYTICASYESNSKQWIFDSHQRVFENTRWNQDHLWKFDLPSTERIKVLQDLDYYSLNSFSLFGSEESLLETMWFREYVLRKSNYQIWSQE